MDFVSIISFALYLATFLAGIALDRRQPNDKAKKWYIAWLYVFLCFGYMTGSDWRAYESEYETGSWSGSPTEFGFSFVFDLAAQSGLDFWLFAGLMKCLYLYAQIRLLKFLTPCFTSCLSICMVTSLLFMLVNYPMRFTAAATFLLFALPLLFKGRVLKFFLISAIGIIFQNTIILTILICLACYFLPDKLLNINKYILSLLYIVFSILVSDVARVAALQDSVFSLFVQFEAKSYSSYVIESNDSFFTIGSLITALLACFVFFIKDKFLSGDSNNKLLLKLAIAASFCFRILLVIPTGFRITMPLSAFSIIIIVSYLYNYNIKIKYIIIALYFLMLSKDLYTGYVYIPYSNSIPYIITQQHLPFSERDDYNLNEYKQRMGHEF